MATPLTVAQFETLSIMPPDRQAELEDRRPGFRLARLNARWNWIQAVLRKRYDVAAMAADPPETALGWLVDLATKDCYDAAGYDPSNPSDESAIKQAFLDAKTEIKEAADSEKGMFELPLLASIEDADGVSKGGPLGYSEQSPYVWADDQADTGRAEDDASRR